MKIGFDNQKYLKLQSERILERVAHFGGKLYLEFGGKLFDDYHASRVLPAAWRAIHGWIVRQPHTKNNDTCVSHTSQNGTPRHQHGGR